MGVKGISGPVVAERSTLEPAVAAQATAPMRPLVKGDGVDSSSKRGARLDARVSLPAPDEKPGAARLAADTAEATGELVVSEGPQQRVALDVERLTHLALSVLEATAEELDAAEATLADPSYVPEQLGADRNERMLDKAKKSTERRAARLENGALDEKNLQTAAALTDAIARHVPDLAAVKQSLSAVFRLDPALAQDPSHFMPTLLSAISVVHGGGPSALLSAMKQLEKTVKMMGDVKKTSQASAGAPPPVAGGAATTRAITGLGARNGKPGGPS
jgi:hypothetical protein